MLRHLVTIICSLMFVIILDLERVTRNLNVANPEGRILNMIHIVAVDCKCNNVTTINTIKN